MQAASARTQAHVDGVAMHFVSVDTTVSGMIHVVGLCDVLAAPTLEVVRDTEVGVARPSDFLCTVADKPGKCSETNINVMTEISPFVYSRHLSSFEVPHSLGDILISRLERLYLVMCPCSLIDLRG